jgi:hypothetical protein
LKPDPISAAFKIMKTLLPLLILSISLPLAAQQLVAKPEARPLADVPGRYVFIVTNKGTIYREVQVMSHTNMDVSFTHQAGMLKLSLGEMPVEMQKAYGYNVFASMDPAVQAQQQKDREEALAELVKKAVRMRLVVQSSRKNGMLCEAYPVVQEKTNKRNFSGEYVMKEGISKRPIRPVIVVDAIDKPLGHDFGLISMYPCIQDSSYGMMYALDPAKALELINAPAKP